jgi:ABC-type glycerol-3-phosphate transport system permease component
MNLSVQTRKSIVSGLLDLITVVFVFLLIFPVIWLFLTAVKTQGEMFGNPYELIPRAVTFDNFTRIWHSAGFEDAFKNSLIVAACTAGIVTSVAFAAAFSLSRFRYGLNGTFANMILAVQMIPGIVLVVPLIGTLRRAHLTDKLAGLVLVYLLIGLPIATWMLKGYLDEIPRDLDEAALVDGAGSTQVLRQILFPLMAPASVAVGAFVFLLSWGEYLFAVSLITSTDKKTLPLALQGAFGQYSIDWGMLLAGGAIICLPPALLFIFFQRFLVGGLTAGGVKG